MKIINNRRCVEHEATCCLPRSCASTNKFISKPLLARRYPTCPPSPTAKAQSRLCSRPALSIFFFPACLLSVKLLPTTSLQPSKQPSSATISGQKWLQLALAEQVSFGHSSEALCKSTYRTKIWRGRHGTRFAGKLTSVQPRHGQLVRTCDTGQFTLLRNPARRRRTRMPILPQRRRRSSALPRRSSPSRQATNRTYQNTQKPTHKIHRPGPMCSSR